MGNKNKNRRIKEVTLADIARETGVSLMTVTRAVHGWKGVHYEMRARILDVAEKLGYTALHSSSKGEEEVRSGKSTIGVLVPRLNCSFYASVIEGIDRWFTPRDYRIIIGCAYDSVDKDSREFTLMLERGVDGIIWCPTVGDNKARRLVSLAVRQNCQVVFIDRAPEVNGVDAVVSDDRRAMSQLVDTLVKSGRRRIAYLSADDQYSVARDRMAGYHDCLANHGIAVDSKSVVSIGTPSTVAAAAAVRKLLKRRNRPDAISAYNDTLALGAELAVLNAGLRIPEDVAITGFSSLPETELVAIPISTARQDMLCLGRTAARLLLRRIHNPKGSVPAVRKVIPTDMILRGSTR